MKLHRETFVPSQIKESLGRTPLPQGNGFLNIPLEIRTEEIDDACNQKKMRAWRGNQELNEKLQLKADELEQLFAEHKLRIHGDRGSTSWRRGQPDVFLADDVFTDIAEKRSGRVFPESSGVEFDVSVSKQKLGDIRKLEDCRGEFYERYMQKRDAKLREEWVCRGAQKEAEMKVMYDSLVCASAEMKATFADSAERQDSVRRARRQAEKLRSFCIHSSMKIREQQVEFLQNEQEEDPQELSEQTLQDPSINITNFGDCSPESCDSKNLLPGRIVYSSTPKTSAVSVPKPPVRPPNSVSGRRKTKPENLLAQSVPNFSDLRKENTKPSSGTSKMTTRSQSRNYSRSQSTREGIQLVKEENTRRSLSMRKSFASPGELKDLSSTNSDSAASTPFLRYSKEQMEEQGSINKPQKSGQSKTFLRKGNGIGPGAGAGIAKLRASVASENLIKPEDPVDMDKEDKEEERSEMLAAKEAPRATDSPYSDNERPRLSQESGISCDPRSENGKVLGSIYMAKENLIKLEEPLDMVKEEEQEERSEMMPAEEAPKATDFPAELDNEKPRLGQESGVSCDPRLKNGEVLGSISQVDDDSTAVLTGISSKFNTSVGIVQESPGESPGSWNSSRGSPTLWNSQPQDQMIQTCGTSQKLMLVSDSSHQPHKDVRKGFRRLLKFGRKSREAESLVTDCISASTTSEGDDETEDGCDPAHRTRMGLSQHHPAFDGCNEGEIFHKQVQPLQSSIPAPPANFKLREDHLSGSFLKAPRSFFSVSSFRSKARA